MSPPKGFIPWNKGLTKKTSPIIKRYADKAIGHKIGMFGKSHSTETIAKMRLAKLGKKFTPMHRKNLSLALTGKKQSVDVVKRRILRGVRHPNWRGGVTPIHERVRKSVEYRDWRIKVFQRDRYTCQGEGCGRVGGTIHAHHIKSFSRYPELRFDTQNGVTLCIECHRKTETYGRQKNTDTKNNRETRKR